jgi:dihydroorotate dehydrogenase
MLAGATVVAVGSHNFTDPLALAKLETELREWCEANQVSEIRSLIGALHA